MAIDTAAPPTGYVQPVVDVAALKALLDGKYAEVRSLVRANLADRAEILEQAETLAYANPFMATEARARLGIDVVQRPTTPLVGRGDHDQHEDDDLDARDREVLDDPQDPRTQRFLRRHRGAG